ncbi:MAG TPA: glycosyltransferase family 1 protein [Candidatus Dormibacteraeota bacterium]
MERELAPLQVVLGAQAAATPESRGRGLGRVAANYAAAFRRLHPELLAGVDEGLDGVRAPGEEVLYHVLSPFELLPLDAIWPAWARDRRHALAVTLYDLVPLLFAERYVPPSAEKLAYMTRLDIVRRADAVLTISEATRRDALQWLGLDPARVHTVYLDCAPGFGPPAGEPRPASLPGLRPGYCLYVGGGDWRKNLGGALAAYSRLPAGLRAAHQLVLAGALSTGTRDSLQAQAARLGIRADLLLAGELPEPDLVSLYQACRLFVFPSLYEGFGLPVLEAMRCGVPVISGDNSSLPELVTESEARFDAADPEATAAVWARALEDAELRSRLLAMGRATAARFSWDRTVELSLAAYRQARLQPVRRLR